MKLKTFAKRAAAAGAVAAALVLIALPALAAPAVDVCVVWIVNLFPLKGIDLALFLCQIPILFRNDSFVLSFINRELRLLNHVHLVSCTLFLFCSSSAVSNLSHINRIVQYIFHKIS